MDLTGLQALQQIMKIYGETNSLEGTYQLFLKIKKDLERLEALEQEHANALQVIKILNDENKAREMKKKVGWF